MKNRRSFIKTAILGGIGFSVLKKIQGKSAPKQNGVVISTWNFGVKANEEAWKILKGNGSALDAVEKGVRLIESDPEERSVGLGGRPDRDGRVTLDACIMDHLGNIGSVACLEHIVNPVSVARAVMEKTPHVMLVGDGALEFALNQGFTKENLLTENSRQEWLEWLKTSQYEPVINIENHDTIGMLTMDAAGNLAGACTTSGLAFKMHGRVGDSPIIGSGLFVDQEIGSATATGHGEEVIRTVGSFRVVEAMRRGLEPEEACKEAVLQIKKIFDRRKTPTTNSQICFLAMRNDGKTGAFALQKGFQYALTQNGETNLMDSNYLLK